MAIAHETTATNSGTSETTLVVTKPSGTVSGDVLLVVISADADAPEVSPPNITAPGGWVNAQSGGNSNMRVHAFSLVAGGSEPSTYSFTASVASTWVSSNSRFSGVDNTTPTRVLAGFTTNSGTDIPMNSPADHTTVVNGEVMVWLANKREGGGSSIGAAPVEIDTVLSTVGIAGGVDQGVGIELRPTAGLVTGARVWLGTGTTANIGGKFSLVPELDTTLNISGTNVSASYGTTSLIFPVTVSVSGTDLSSQFGTSQANMTVNVQGTGPIINIGDGTVVSRGVKAAGFNEPANTPDSNDSSGGGFYNTHPNRS